MSGTGESLVDFAGEERFFRIRLGEIRRIEDRCGVGIGEVLRRVAQAYLVLSRSKNEDGTLNLPLALATGIEVRADDVREPIYQGLLAAMSPQDATKLIRPEIDDRGVRGLLDNVPVALAALIAARDAPPGEPTAGAPDKPATSAKRPTSASSTGSARRSASAPAKSTP